MKQCSQCVHCKVKTVTRIQPSYFQNGGMCPPIVKKHLRLTCAKENETGVVFTQNYYDMAAFENDNENFKYAESCGHFESDD